MEGLLVVLTTEVGTRLYLPHPPKRKLLSGRKNFSPPFEVPLAGPRIKLTGDWLTGEKQKFNNMYICGRDQEDWVTHQNGRSRHLARRLQLKTKDVSGSGVELNSQEDEEEQEFAEQMFALLYRDNGTQRGVLTNTLRWVPLSAQLVPIILCGSVVVAPFGEEILYLNSFRKLGDGQRFLSLWGLACFQLKIMDRSKRHIWGWQVLLLFPSAATQCKQLFTSRWWLGRPRNVKLTFE